jgi:hypothetical protein
MIPKCLHPDCNYYAKYYSKKGGKVREYCKKHKPSIGYVQNKYEVIHNSYVVTPQYIMRGKTHFKELILKNKNDRIQFKKDVIPILDNHFIPVILNIIEMYL